MKSSTTISKKYSGNPGEQINTSPDFQSEIPIEVPARRGFSISHGGKTLLSRIDPVAQGERAAAEITVKERTLYLCPSPLYGYGLSLFLGRLSSEIEKKNSAVLCVEADEKLFEISQKALGEMEASFLELKFHEANTFALAKASDPEQICAFVRETWGERMFRRVEVIRLSAGWQLFPGLYENIEAALKREIAVEWGNAITLIKLGRLYARNLIRNLALLGESKNISALNLGSSPVLALGAGPSMDSFLDELSLLAGGNIRKPDQRRFKIICADTCLPALHERGILPDLAVILESQHWNLKDFSGIRGLEIDAAIDLSALPASARVLGGCRFFFATPWTNLRLFTRLNEAGLLPKTFAPLGSVGLSVVALALSAGSGPVLITGLDFSYTPDAYHARSTPGRADRERKQNRFRSIINAGAAFREGSFPALSETGKPVRSDPSMRNYRDLFEQEFGGNPRLLNIAGAGLSLGVKTVSAAEALAILNGEGGGAVHKEAAVPPFQPGDLSADWQREKIETFIRREINILKELRDMLSGEIPLNEGRLEELLDTADYAWAHFPECAGAGGQRTGGKRPLCTDLGFLKRVRTEIEPFLKCWGTSNEPRGAQARKL